MGPNSTGSPGCRHDKDYAAVVRRYGAVPLVFVGSITYFCVFQPPFDTDGPLRGGPFGLLGLLDLIVAWTAIGSFFLLFGVAGNVREAAANARAVRRLGCARKAAVRLTEVAAAAGTLLKRLNADQLDERTTDVLRRSKESAR
jgi:hypothetical protein